MKTILFALLAFLPAFAGDSPFAFRDINGVSLELTEKGKPVFAYNYGMILAPGFPEAMRRSTYLHPVYAPDGTVLTDDFNPDHPHHRGISWMWQVVRVGGHSYDLWTVQGIRERFVGWTAREIAPGYALLGVRNGWYVGDRKVVDEHVEIRVSPAAAGVRYLDFQLRFEATDEPVEIVGTAQENKGFGGFCFRFAPRDGGEAATAIRTDTGLVAKDGILAVHPWAQIEGVFHGHSAGARIDDDASNPGFPNGWLLRHGFGFLNVSYPGLKPLTLKPGHPLELHYRVTLMSPAR
jgi:hypothetical protein